jgi:hypothetical protein
MTRMRVSGSSGVSLVYSRAVRNVHRADGVGLESVGISLSDEAEIPPLQKGGAALAFHSAAARGAASVVLTFTRARGCEHCVSPIFSFYGCFTALRLHVSHVRPVLYCIVLSSQLCCLRVVCIHEHCGVV